MSEERQIQRHATPDALPLTPREQEVLKELALGNSNKLIARALSISPYTVDGYVKDIYRKLGVRNRSMATALAVHLGILDVQSIAAIYEVADGWSGA